MSYLPSNRNASLIDIFRAWPELARPIHQFGETLMRGDSPFEPGERELIAAFVSTLNGCDYCRGSHGRAAEHFGLDPDLVDQCIGDIDGSDVPDRLKPVLRYCRKLNDDPANVSQRDAQAVFDAGWNETALCHAVLVCGFFNLMNRWVEGLGVEADPKAMDMAAKMLHERGYKAISDLTGDRDED